MEDSQPPLQGPLLPTFMAAVAAIAAAAVALFGFHCKRVYRPRQGPETVAMAATMGYNSFNGDRHSKPMGNRRPTPRQPLAPLNLLGGTDDFSDESYDDVEMQFMHYFTYKALKLVMNAMLEEDDSEEEYNWLYQFMGNHPFVATDSEGFMKELAKTRPDLAMLVGDVRLQLWTGWMNKNKQEKVYDRIKESNLEVMKYQLGRSIQIEGNDS